MAYTVVCDVCENSFTRKEWKKNPGIEATIPANMLGDLGLDSDDFTFCSWQCLARLVFRYTSEGSDGSDEHDDDHDDETQIASLHEVQHNQSNGNTDTPDTGVFFPEGMRVDGKPAGTLKRRS